MVTSSQSRLGLRAATLMVWALAGASAVYWGLRMTAPMAAPAAAMPLADPPAVDAAAVARLLGSVPQSATAVAPPPSVSSRFALVGVLAGRSNGGAALIAVDGQPAKPFRVGSEVDPGLVLQAVERGRAVLGASRDAEPSFTLDMPPPGPATGPTGGLVLPVMTGRPAPAAAPAVSTVPTGRLTPSLSSDGGFVQAPAR